MEMSMNRITESEIEKFAIVERLQGH